MLCARALLEQPPPAAAEAATAHLRPGAQVEGRLPEGTKVAVPSAMWPAYTCDEMGGEAWLAIVLSSTGLTARVRFAHAKTPTGRDYEDVRLPLGALRRVE